ncbi:MAG: hypothetical protein ACRD2T_02175, partial [Thermoanaerobaculia bacterium]
FNQHRVDLVLQGHTHFYERTFPLEDGARTDAPEEPDYADPEGTVYIVAGGGGGTLAAATPKAFSAFYRSTFHHLRVHVEGAKLTLEAIDLEGRVLDRMTIAKTVAPPAPSFKRGDTNGDGTVDLTDPVALLGYLFLGQAIPECLDAADADDSGDLVLTDAIVSLGWQFLGGEAPPDPGPSACGPDRTPRDPPFAACVYPAESCR